MKHLKLPILFALLLSMFGTRALAYDTLIDGVYYNFYETDATVTASPSNSKYSGNIVIPESVIYEGVTYNVTIIDYQAFRNCDGLTSVKIGNNVVVIGDYAFYGCSNLTNVKIGNGVTDIGRGAFYSCSSISSMEIGNSVKYIGIQAFSNCSSLTSISIPDGMVNIDSWAFEGCSKLASIVIPNSVKTIGDSAFSGCLNLSSVTISNGVTMIAHRTFLGCISLTSVEIPYGVTSIGMDAFSGCRSLTSVMIPGSVETINSNAFIGCSSLTSVTIPSSVMSIGNAIFENCSSLSSISVDKGNTMYDSRDNCNAIIQTSLNKLIAGCKNTVIPNSITNIARYAFCGCTGLTSITIPANVTTIGESAFEGCNSLTTVTVGMTKPVAIELLTFTYRASATLYVPIGSKAAYEAADYWKDFKEIIEDKKCAMPTISLVDGKLHFECETEGVEYHYEFTTPASGNGIGNDVAISSTYVVKVYASKDGIADSDVATAQINVAGQKGDADGNGVVDIADAVHIVNYITGKITTLAPQTETTPQAPQ
jgi:hypothetical protein